MATSAVWSSSSKRFTAAPKGSPYMKVPGCPGDPPPSLQAHDDRGEDDEGGHAAGQAEPDGPDLGLPGAPRRREEPDGGPEDKERRDQEEGGEGEHME